MLGFAISLEVVAIAAIFGLGGVGLGLTVLGMTVLLLVVSIALDRRHIRRSGTRKLWTYYAVNDRFSDRAHSKRLAGLGGPIAPPRPPGMISFEARLKHGRFGQPFDRN